MFSEAIRRDTSRTGWVMVNVEPPTREQASAALDALRAELEANSVAVKDGTWGYRLLVVDGALGGRDPPVRGPVARGARCAGSRSGCVARAGAGGDRGMSTVVSRQEALDELGEAFRTVSGAMRRLQGRETHRAGEVSFAQ